MTKKHIVIDARIRRSSTGRPVDWLLTHLQTLDSVHKYTVLLEADDEWKPTAKNFKAIPIKYRGFSLNPFQQISFSWFLYKLKPDLVHFTLSGYQPLFYFGPQICMTHDLTMYKYARAGRLPKWVHALRMRGYRLLMWQAHRLAKQIIVPTQYGRDALAKLHLFTNRKITIINEASELVVNKGAVKPEQAPDDFILYVGSCFPHKNIKRILDAMVELQADYPDLKFVHAGKLESYAKRVKRRAKNMGLEHKTVFLGFVSDDELKWLYQHARAYVFPSLSEGWGLPGLEAMEYGCPVASSNATCLPEVYGVAAEYFDPESTEDTVRAIRTLLKNEKRRAELIKLGKKQVTKYSWRRMAEQTLAVYSQLLD